MRLRILAPCVFLLSAACPSCQDPPAPECPSDPGPVIPLCEIVKAEMIIEGSVSNFSTSSRVLSIEGFPLETTFTPAAVAVRHALRGEATGRLDVLVPGCIDAAGESMVGPMLKDGDPADGFFFIKAADGYAVLVPQGFFRREGALLRNRGEAEKGLTESELKATIQQFDKVDCPNLDGGVLK